MLIKNAAISPQTEVDLRVGGGLITQLGPSLPCGVGEVVVDARGHALIPGLHDHHMHLLACAAARQSLDCGTNEINCLEALQSALSKSVREGVGEIRGIGYYEHGQPLIDRDWLDRISTRIPIRIQHRTGRLWILNSPALNGIGESDAPAGAERDISGRLTGRFYHLDEWLRDHLPHAPPSLQPISDQLARYGVTGITDTGPDNNDAVLEILIAAQRNHELHQSVLLMGNESLRSYHSDSISTGHCKLYLKESDLPELDCFISTVEALHKNDRPVAIHCVTRVELQFALTALAEAGAMAGDRIEHASIADDEALAQIAGLNLTVVTQPHFVAERGEQYKSYVERSDQAFLYRGKGFLDRRIALAAGTDAPYGTSDPWVVMRSAVDRKTATGDIMMPMEALSPEQALSLFTGHCLAPGRVWRTIDVGKPADLCLLSVSWKDMLQQLDSECVRATFCRGDIVYGLSGEI